MSNGIVTQGTEFRVSDDSGSTYEVIGCVEQWDRDEPARGEIDTTCLSATAKTFKFGLRDNGTVNVDVITSFDNAGQLMLADSYSSDAAYTFQIEYSDNAGTSGTIKTFEGFVISMSESGSKDDVIRSSVGIKISGDVVTTAAAA